MSDVSRGPGWWMASDGKWYPPELHPNAPPQQPVVQAPPVAAPIPPQDFPPPDPATILTAAGSPHASPFDAPPPTAPPPGFDAPPPTAPPPGFDAPPPTAPPPGFDAPPPTAPPPGFGPPPGTEPFNQFPTGQIAVTPAPGTPKSGRAVKVILPILILVILAVVIGAYLKESAKKTTTTPPKTTAASPAQLAVLKAIGVQLSEVPTGTTVQLITNGQELQGQPTLTLCGARFPSESLRVARYQVKAVAVPLGLSFSTEAVVYKSTAAAAEAISQVREAAQACPATFVPANGGATKVKFSFMPSPDLHLAQVPGETRVGLFYTVTTKAGLTSAKMDIYLQRGPYLLGVYLDASHAFIPVKSVASAKPVSSVPAITQIFETNMKKAPATGY